MNCIEFRRLTMEDITRTPAMEAHARECPSCRGFAARMRAQDADIARAVNVPVPENLAARVLFAQRTADSREADFDDALAAAADVPVPSGLAERILERARAEAPEAPEAPPAAPASNSNDGKVVQLSRRAALTRFALAASIAVGVATAALVGVSQRGEPQLVDHLIAHVEGEPWLLEADTPLSRGDLEPVLRTVGVDLDDMPGEVVKAFPCPFRPTPSLHMVMRGTHDKVTVLVMPGDDSTDMQVGSSDAMKGIVVPVRNGSIGIIGDPREDLAGHAERVRKLLRWRL